MPSERPTRPIRDEQVDEVRPRGQQLAELVDDDEQVGHRGRASASAVAPGVWYSHDASTLPAWRSIVWRRSCSPISASRIRSTSDEVVAARFVIMPATCGSRGEVREGRAALEVDEHETRACSGACVSPGR